MQRNAACGLFIKSSSMFRLIHTKGFFGKIISSDLMGAGPATAADPDEFAMAAFPFELL